MLDRILISCAVILAGCTDAGYCDGQGFRAALAASRVGDTVEIGECEIDIDATIEVPQGVTVQGKGADRSVLRGGGDGSVLLVRAGGTDVTRLMGLRIESDSSMSGVTVVGSSGLAELRDVEVRATRGVALGVLTLDGLEMSNVTLTGPTDATSADALSPAPDPGVTATHGLVLQNVVRAELLDVRTNGFATYGALLTNSAVTWLGGDADRNAGIGIAVEGGRATLTDVSIADTWAVGGRAIAPMGLVAYGRAVVDTDAVRIERGEGYGFVASEATATNVDFTSSQNQLPGVWVQRAEGIEFEGATDIQMNRQAGVVMLDSLGIQMNGGVVSGIQMAPRSEGELGSIQVGDGIQMVGEMTDVSLSNIQMMNNGRVGLLLDVSGGSLNASFTSVTIGGEGGQLGALAQSGTVPAGWDSGIQREGAVAGNDAAFSGTLDTVSVELALPSTGF